MRQVRKGKDHQEHGKVQAPIRSTGKFPSFEADFNNSTLKDCPHKIQRIWQLLTCMNTELPMREIFTSYHILNDYS